jgi:hypothetical protein
LTILATFRHPDYANYLIRDGPNMLAKFDDFGDFDDFDEFDEIAQNFVSICFPRYE